ncbi:hypothetical protein BGW38_005023 [Lunasporangiospora selenospora]|uniref:Uncharacterized protein n=1 Tax=Lunasporangiospora selenospora TaxID=979761 RepID=A0A9P6G1U9_9FUNG|nr:hypothetical protein BGW38_005023 [Lunasporangiospora selenospora]
MNLLRLLLLVPPTTSISPSPYSPIANLVWTQMDKLYDALGYYTYDKPKMAQQLAQLQNVTIRPLSYMQHLSLDEGMIAHLLYPPMFLGFFCSLGSYQSLGMVQDVAHALVDPIAERLQSLCIQIGDWPHYLDWVDRFQSLSLLRIHGYYHMTNYSELTTFVKRHTTLFPGTLRALDVPFQTPIPVQDLIEIMRALPTPRQWTWIDGFRWMQFMIQSAYAKEDDRSINLDQLCSLSNMDLDLDSDRLRESSEWTRLVDQLAPFRFLHQCRRLQTLRWRITHLDTFREMAQTRAQILSTPTPTTAAAAAHDSLSPPLRSMTLLQDLELDTIKGDFAPAINDAVLSYGNSLRTLRIALRSVAEDGMLGYCWNLPQLKTLEIHQHSTTKRLILDPDTFSSCVQLQSLDIIDPLDDEIVRTVSLLKEPVMLTNGSGAGAMSWIHNLQKLHLCGTPTLSTDLDHILVQVQPNLTHLTLALLEIRDFRNKTYQDPRRELFLALNSSRIPILQSLSRNETWPQLRVLKLEAVFAYRFEFEMLAHCPLLEQLVLDLGSWPQARTITRDDLVLTNPTQSDDPANGLTGISPQSLLLPRLERLELYGHWLVSEPIWELLLWRVMPNLVELIERHCQGFTLYFWIQTTMQLPRLRHVSSRLRYTKRHGMSVGLQKNNAYKAGPRKEWPRRD